MCYLTIMEKQVTTLLYMHTAQFEHQIFLHNILFSIIFSTICLHPLSRRPSRFSSCCKGAVERPVSEYVDVSLWVITELSVQQNRVSQVVVSLHCHCRMGHKSTQSR